jgi:hypothetical protein
MPVTLSEPKSIDEPFTFVYPECEPFAIGESIVLGKPDADALGTPLSDGESTIFCATAEGFGRRRVSGWRGRVRVPPLG